MDISKKKRYLVAGSSDFLIKIATLEDMNQCGIFSGHDAPILSVKVSPDEKNLVRVVKLYTKVASNISSYPYLL